MFRTFIIEKLLKDIYKYLSKIEIKELNSFKIRLRENPYLGDPIRVPYIREKKIKGKRVYFIIYEKYNAILFVAISNKKQQKRTIDAIFTDLKEFEKYLISKL